MLSVPFFSDDDVERMARYAWEWNLIHGLTEQSWEIAKKVERERAEFIVMRLNERMSVA